MSERRDLIALTPRPLHRLRARSGLSVRSPEMMEPMGGIEPPTY